VDDFDIVMFESFILTLVVNIRQRRQTSSDFVVVFADSTPRINNDGLLEVAFIVRNDQGGVVNAMNLMSAIEANENALVAAVSNYGNSYCCCNKLCGTIVLCI